MKGSWTTEWPTEEGLYWFYGYRYGRMSIGMKKDPMLQLVKVRKDANGSMMFISEGNFMYKSEVEKPHFMLVDLPEFPEMMRRRHETRRFYQGDRGKQKDTHSPVQEDGFSA